MYVRSVYIVLEKTQWDISNEVKVLCENMKPPETRRSDGRPKKVRIASHEKIGHHPDDRDANE
jgi:hypothetical protein